ncbi:alpha/beta fold hydrolase [Bacillus sp. CBEL-1]|uniref:alpha/beta fold hydrolase n=2 Tax=Bacillaceae TaxID=186817 RepID=UPI00104FDAC1|nr:alpha/beta fold hydrolase [Bacillus sp. CBEL-1]TDB55387.1 alpha/beta fold hydrolase [Bacillus sp. CBEL-1]
MSTLYEPLCLSIPRNFLGGEEKKFKSNVGELYYIVRGEGKPLLLIHSVSLGASNATWRENIDVLAKHFKVYALELPGFGRSEKLPIVYKPTVFIQAIAEFIQQVIQKPAYVLSRDLPAAYCLYVAYYYPKLIRKIALITPSGIGSNDTEPCESSLTTFNTFTQPFVGNGVYNAFSSKESIEYQLKTLFYTKPELVTEEVLEDFYRASHQCPNANYAPASFVAGFANINIQAIFPFITQSVLILWGQKARFNPISNLQKFVQLNPSVKVSIFKDSGLLLQEEEKDKFNQTIVNYFRQ